MPALSQAQQRLFAIAEHEPDKLYARNRSLLGMSHQQLRDFAATPRKGLPVKVNSPKRPTVVMKGVPHPRIMKSLLGGQ